MNRNELPNLASAVNPLKLQMRGLLAYREGGFWYTKNPEIKSGFFSGWIRITDPQTAEQFDAEAKGAPPAREPIKLEDKAINAAVLAFQMNPEWQDVYICHDGRVIEGNAFRAKMTSRTAQLVSIQQDGIPMNVSRQHHYVQQRLVFGI